MKVVTDRERNIEEAIDRAVRRMTAIEPRPGLRIRVLREIERPAPHGFRVLWRAAATAAAIVALLAVWLVRPVPVPAPEEIMAGLPAPAPASTVADPSAAPDHVAPVSGGRRIAALAPHPPKADAVPLDVSDGSVGVAIEPLERIDEIAFEALASPALESPAVVITPLARIEPVRVAPLPAAGERN